MVDVVPFRGGDFLGSLEVQGKLDSYSKQLRIQRLKEVRQQENSIALKRCASYRQCIDERKSVKMCRLKEQKRNNKLNELDQLVNKWQGAVKESGGAHRLANDNVNILMKKTAADASLHRKRKAEEIQREKLALQIRQEQILEAQRESLRQQGLQQVKKEIRMSNREDAHAMGEAYAARQQLLDCQTAALDRMHSVPKVYMQSRVQQGAVSIEQRFPVEVHARIWRHGARGRDDSVIRNGAFVEESAIMKKHWQLVMREMQNRIRTKVRARTAQRTVECQKGVQFLDSELQLLETADKSHGRQFRLCSSLGVHPDVEEPRLQHTFEKMFLSKPVRLDSQHAMYRTGSHLVQAALDSRAVEESHTATDARFGSPSPVRRYSQPTWTSSSLPDYNLGPAEDSFAEEASVKSGGSMKSSTASEELHVIHRGTAADIPLISRPPPSWSATKQPVGGKADVSEAPLPQARSANAVSSTATSTQNAAAAIGRESISGLAVRIPQVAAQTSGPVANKSAPWPMSLASESTSSSSEIVSVQSISGDGSSFWVEEGQGRAEPPLTIQISGVLDGPRVGASTPPRDTSSRGSNVPRPIDPFTPPEASLSKQKQQAQQHGALNRLAADRDVVGTPQSDISSTNTEQARHDRLPVPVPGRKNPSPKLAAGVFDDSVTSSDVTGTSGGSLSTSPSSSVLSFGPDRKVGDLSSAKSSASPPQRQARYPVLDIDEVPDSEEALGDLNVSALTEQMLLGASMERYDTRRSSSSASRSRSSASSQSSSSPSSAPGGSKYTSSSKSSSEDNLSRGSSSTSSSSSMLSYLQSSPLPAASTKPVQRTEEQQAAAAVRSAGITITVAGAASSTVPRYAAAVSPSHSIQSDTVSMLSANSDEIRFAHSLTSTGPLDSFQHLTRQELQDILDDIDDEDSASEISENEDSHAQRRRHSEKEEATEDSSNEEEEHLQTYLQQASVRANQDYESMFDDDGADDNKDVDYYANRAHTAAGRGGLQFERIDEVSHEEDSAQEDLQSLASESTNELFDKWQQLYQGSLKLGDNARAVRNQRVTAYNASTSIAIVDADTHPSSTGTPARSIDRTSRNTTPAGAESSTFNDVSRTSASAAAASVLASPLDVLRFPRAASGSSLLHDSTMRTSLSSQSSAGSSGTLSDDSLSPVRKAGSAPALVLSPPSSPAAGVKRYVQYDSAPSRAQVSDVRASYDDVRATHLLGELDRLSQSWQKKQAYYSSGAAATGQSPARGAPAARLQPTGPAPYASPSSLLREPVVRDAARASDVTRPSAADVSVSSLSVLISPPDSSAEDDKHAYVATSHASNVVGQREAYAGRLVVHSEHRTLRAAPSAAAPVIPAGTRPLAAQLGLDDSMNSSIVSGGEGGAYGDSALYSSQDEGDDPSLEELLNTHSTSGATLGRIQNEIAEMRKRLLATVGAPAGSVPTHAADVTSCSRVTLQVHQESRTSAAGGAVPARSTVGAVQRDEPAAPAAGGQSSGEDTYSSSRYYSAGEARNTSGSTMHTADSGPRLPSPYEADLPISSGGYRSMTYASATATTSVTTRTLTSTQTSTTMYGSTTRAGTGTSTSTSAGLYDDSMRPQAYSFSRRSPAGKAGAPSTVRAELDDSLASPSPSVTAVSDSRLSEYAMLSTHSLTTTMMRSPGETSPPPRSMLGQDGSEGGPSYQPSFGSPDSDSSGGRDMRHYPSHRK